MLLRSVRHLNMTTFQGHLKGQLYGTTEAVPCKFLYARPTQLVDTPCLFDSSRLCPCICRWVLNYKQAGLGKVPGFPHNSSTSPATSISWGSNFEVLVLMQLESDMKGGTCMNGIPDHVTQSMSHPAYYNNSMQICNAHACKVEYIHYDY